MHEIKVTAVVDVSQEIMVACGTDTAPTHVWHWRLLTPGHFPCDSRDDTEAFGIVFFGALGQQLHAQANTQNRLRKGLYEFADMTNSEPVTNDDSSDARYSMP